ncbi:uncharacterized protein LOC144987729 [Oryzias latipes]
MADAPGALVCEDCKSDHCHLPATIQRLRSELKEKYNLIDKILSVSASQSNYITYLQQSVIVDQASRSLSQTLPWSGGKPAEADAHSTCSDSNIVQLRGVTDGLEPTDEIRGPGNPNSGESGRFPADLEQEKADAGLRDPALSSTPKLSWAEVTRRSRRSHGPKTDPSCSAKLALSNRYAPLAEDPGPTVSPTNQQDPPGLGLCQRRPPALPSPTAGAGCVRREPPVSHPSATTRVRNRGAKSTAASGPASNESDRSTASGHASREPRQSTFSPGAAAPVPSPDAAAIPSFSAAGVKRRRLLRDAV